MRDLPQLSSLEGGGSSLLWMSAFAMPSSRSRRSPWFSAVQAVDGLAAHRSTPFLLLETSFKGLRTPERTGIMVALASASLDDNPKPSQLGQRRCWPARFQGQIRFFGLICPTNEGRDRHGA